MSLYKDFIGYRKSKKAIKNSGGFIQGLNSTLANWNQSNQKKHQTDHYLNLPEISNPINYLAKAFSNAELKTIDLKTGEEIPDHILLKILKNPNPLQSGSSFLESIYTDYKLYGNVYPKSFNAVGYNQKTYEAIMSIWKLPAEYIQPILKTNRYFGTSSMEELISGYSFRVNGKKEILEPSSILHIRKGFSKFPSIEGMSILVSLSKPISNLYKIYGAENILTTRHGSIGLLTNNQTMGEYGTQSLDTDKVEMLQKDFSKYGLSEDQYQYIITDMNLKFQSTIANVKDLQLDEKQKKHRNTILDAFGFPGEIFNDMQKATFNNKDKADKMVYQNVIIPDSEIIFDEFNVFFGTEQNGIKLVGSYDHVAAMQPDKLVESRIYSTNSKTAETQFLKGLITRNQWLVQSGFPEVKKEEFNKYIYELSPKELAIILDNFTTIVE